jgi:hypothetical protein
MAEQTEATQQEQQTEREEKNGGKNGGDSGRKTAVRAAVIAAATSATAIAAKKAFSGREGSQSGEKQRSGGSGNEDSMVGTMIASGWHAAKDSLLPFAEEAAGSAGEYLARNGPDFVRETLVPRFIRGFEQAQESADSAA